MSTPTDPQEREAAHSPLPWKVSPHSGRVVMSGAARVGEAKVNDAALIVEAVNNHAETRKLADEVTRLRGVQGSTLVDACLLIERIVTHIDRNRNSQYLYEQIYMAAANAREIGPRLAKLAGIPWLPSEQPPQPKGGSQ